MKTKNILVIFLLFVSFTGCEVLLMEDDPENTPQKNFEILWETIDERYAFFRFKEVDWDQVKDKYEKKIFPEMSDKELFQVLSNMLYELKDGHVNLRSTFNRSRNWTWKLDYPANYNETIVERNYLGDDYWITGPLKNTVIDSIGYVYYGSFSSNIREAHIDTIISRFSNKKGMIIDIRNNGGGSLSNGDRIVSRFIEEKTQVGYRLYKNGPGHNDFTEAVGMTIKPGGDQTFPTDKPVVILMNRACYSAANDFVMKMNVLPNVFLIGDRTGGGGGLPVYSELPNGWIFRYSSTITLSTDKKNVEDGIEPHIQVDLKREDEINGIDTLIESALSLIDIISNQ